LTKQRGGIEIKQAGCSVVFSEGGMKTLRLLAVGVGLLAVGVGLFACEASAAGGHRDPGVILKEYDAIKMPTLDAGKRKDADSVRRFNQEKEAAVEQQNDLAKELYRADPHHPRAFPLMAARLGRMMSGKDSAQAISEALALVRAHPEEEQGANLLEMVAHRTTDKTKRLSIYHRIVAGYPGTRAAKTAQGSIRQMEGIGKPFDLSFNDAITGKPVSMSALRGKVVVIDFWATWCGPCVAEMSKMKDLYAKYKRSGVEFIGVSLDGPGEGLNKLKAFVRDRDIDWPQFYQGQSWNSEFSQSWGIGSIPTVFVVDAQGILYSTDARGQLATLIPELIAKKDGRAIESARQTSLSRDRGL
jgi:thiol-disulfide isomerase/thioredoxin